MRPAGEIRDRHTLRYFAGISFLLLILLLPSFLMPSVISSELRWAFGQSGGTTSTSGTMNLQQGYYNSTEIYVPATSLVIYLTSSDNSVYTAIMTYQQFSNFTQALPEEPIFHQSGVFNYNALLLPEGAYYLVVYADQGAASITYFYEVDSNLRLQNSTTSVSELFTIPPNSQRSVPIHLETMGAPSIFRLGGISNETLSFSLYDRSNDTVIFSSPQSTITNLIVAQDGRVSLGYNLSLTPDQYTLFITNSHPTPVLTYFQYKIDPQFVNPYLTYLFRTDTSALPTGIASFGVYNYSGKMVPYSINSSTVLGFAKIESISSFNQNVSSPILPDEVTLQLNSILTVQNYDNSTFDYWPQDVLDFFTKSQNVSYVNNVLNVTGDDAYLDNQTIRSQNGFVVSAPDGGYYYGNYLNRTKLHYDLPLAFFLVLNEVLVKSQGVWINMGVKVLQNGTQIVTNSTTTWFDKIFIEDPNAASASYMIRGDSYTPAGARLRIGQFYDAELVFGGGGNGALAHFDSLSADLSLYYFDNRTVAFETFPSVYSFGADTAEATDNLHATFSGSYVSLTTGTPNYDFLANGPNSTLDTVVSRLLNKTSVSSSTTTAAQTTLTRASLQFNTTSTSVTSTTAASSKSSFSLSGGSAGPISPLGLALIAAIPVSAFAVLAIAISARRGNRGTKPRATQSRSCPVCGNRLELGDVFCSNCGSRA